MQAKNAENQRAWNRPPSEKSQRLSRAVLQPGPKSHSTLGIVRTNAIMADGSTAGDLWVDERLLQTNLARSGAQDEFASDLARRFRMHFDVRVTRAALLLLTILACGRAPSLASPSQGVPGSSGPVDAFEPLEKWKRAVLAADAATLLAMYSVDPAAAVGTVAGKANEVKKEVEFWTSLKS